MLQTNKDGILKTLSKQALFVMQAQTNTIHT